MKPDVMRQEDFERWDWERFWMKVDRTGDCWIWQGAKRQDDYGVWKWRGKLRKAHRVAYTLSKGTIPEDLTIDHTCRTKLCCNPDHLEPVTQSENALRFVATRVRICKCGKPSPCRECFNAYHRAYRERNPERIRQLAKESYERIGRETRRARDAK